MTRLRAAFLIWALLTCGVGMLATAQVPMTGAGKGAPGVSVAPFLNDTFTDTPGTLITAHTPNTGSAYVLQPSSTPPGTNATIDTNKLYSPSGGGAFQNQAVPANANYYVESLFTSFSSITPESVGITGRADTTNETYYLVRNNEAVWTLFSFVAGTPAALGTPFVDVFTSGSRTVRLTMSGTTISVQIDGVTQISVTDSSIAAAGRAGLRFGAEGTAQSNTTGIHIMSLTASN